MIGEGPPHRNQSGRIPPDFVDIPCPTKWVPAGSEVQLSGSKPSKMAYFLRLMARFSLALTLAAVLLAATATTAFAHPILEEAQARFDEADFEGALEAFQRAEQAGDLTRDDVIQLYVQRALVHHTLGDEENLETDLMRLASLEPNYEFGRSVPPVVREAFDRAKERTTGRIRVQAEAQSHAGGVRLEARVTNDTSGIVQEVRLGARAPGNAWTQRSNSVLEMPTTSDQTLEIYAEAIGPGGAVLASDGTPDDPVIGTVAELAERDFGTTAGGGGNGNGNEIIAPRPEPEGGGVPAWPFIVGGGVLLAAGAAVLIALLVAGGSNNTALMPPVVQP